MVRFMKVCRFVKSLNTLVFWIVFLDKRLKRSYSLKGFGWLLTIYLDFSYEEKGDVVIVNM